MVLREAHRSRVMRNTFDRRLGWGLSVHRLVLSGACLILALALSGCAQSEVPAGSGTGGSYVPDYLKLAPSSIEATESLAQRAEMEAHLAEVLPRLGLPAGSTAGTAIAEWDYSASRVPTDGASPWLGTAQVTTPYYYVPVLVGGDWIETLTTQKYGGRWRVWSDRSNNESVERAHNMLAAHFGTAGVRIAAHRRMAVGTIRG